MHIVFMLQCQKVQNNCQIAETRVILIVCNGILYHVCPYTLTCIPGNRFLPFYMNYLPATCLTVNIYNKNLSSPGADLGF